MTVPSKTDFRACAPRSAGRVTGTDAPQHHGTLAESPSSAPLPASARHYRYDPVHLTWMEVKRPDDLSPRPDPLGPSPLGLADGLTLAGLTLRAWAPGDDRALCAVLGDAAVWRHLPEPAPQTLDAPAARNLILAANTLPEQSTRAVIHAGTPIGQVRLDWSKPDPHPARGAAAHGEAEISYWLGSAYWGRGLGSAIVAGATRRAFTNRQALLRVTAKVHPGNPASARVLQKAGFRPAAPPDGAGFADWQWFALRRQHLAVNSGG